MVSIRMIFSHDECLMQHSFHTHLGFKFVTFACFVTQLVEIEHVPALFVDNHPHRLFVQDPCSIAWVIIRLIPLTPNHA